MLKTQPDIQLKFQRLRQQWQSDTAHFSSVEQRAIHPSYQQIIGMGPDVVPLLLQGLDEDPDDWFWALHAITCENPIAEENRGNMKAMAKDWTEWGRQHNLI